MKKYVLNIAAFLGGIGIYTFLALLPTPTLAGNVVLMCPDLARAEQLGACPSDKELRANYRKTCPTFMEKRGECRPFETFARGKNKALWAAVSGTEEFLSYLSCATTAEAIKTSKPVSVTAKCDLKSGRCEARCGYDNALTFNLRVKGACKTTPGQKVDCSKDPKACVVTCELFED